MIYYCKDVPLWAKYKAQNGKFDWYWFSDEPMWSTTLRGYVPRSAETVMAFAEYGVEHGKKQCIYLLRPNHDIRSS